MLLLTSLETWADVTRQRVPAEAVLVVDTLRVAVEGVLRGSRYFWSRLLRCETWVSGILWTSRQDRKQHARTLSCRLELALRCRPGIEASRTPNSGFTQQGVETSNTRIVFAEAYPKRHRVYVGRGEVLVDLAAMREVEGDRPVDLLERKRREALGDDRLRREAIQERVDYRVERDARFRYSVASFVSLDVLGHHPFLHTLSASFFHQSCHKRDADASSAEQKFANSDGCQLVGASDVMSHESQFCVITLMSRRPEDNDKGAEVSPCGQRPLPRHG